MSLPSASATLKRRFWRPRFSLRALLIGMTLLCLVFAPALPELNRNNHIAQQVKIIEEMGGYGVFVDRPPNFFAQLMQRLWPVRLAHLDHDLLMAEFNERTVDLGKLRQAPDVRGVCFNECLFTLPDDEPELTLPRIEYVQLQERDDVKGGKPDPAILRRFPAYFPNVCKAQLMGVPQEQELIDSLAGCERLEDLDLWFSHHSAAPVNATGLGALANLQRLRLSGVRTLWHWSFLTQLHRLQDVELGTELDEVGGQFWMKLYPKEGKVYEPSNALAHLVSLRRVVLFEGSEGWVERSKRSPLDQLKLLAENNRLECFHIPRSWPHADALEILESESELQKLSGVRVGSNTTRIFKSLARFPRLCELEIDFDSLDDEDLRRLSELKSLERIVFSFNPHQGNITDKGIALFRQLPIADLRSRYSSGLPLAEGMQRLVDSWPGPHPGMPRRQTDEGVRFLQGK